MTSIIKAGLRFKKAILSRSSDTPFLAQRALFCTFINGYKWILTSKFLLFENHAKEENNVKIRKKNFNL